MISAIAARKAAAAALAAQPIQSAVPETTSPLPSSSRTPPATPLPTPPSPGKKRKQPDSTRPKERVAAPKRQKSRTSDTAPPSATIAAPTPAAPVTPVAAAPPLVRRQKRAFSPSRPLSDSSDDDGDDSAEVVAHEEPPAADVQMDDTLSTYRPTLSQNLFALEPDERSELAPSDGSYLAIMHAPERLSLVGTVSLVVLQGTITLDGCPGGEDVPPSELATALNGGIVALVAAESGAVDLPQIESETDLSVPYAQGTPFPAPSLSRCVGLALVRYAAAGVPYLHVLTPVEPAVFAQCRVLVKGELELPIWAWLDHRVEDGRIGGLAKDKVPYLQWGVGEGKGATRRRVRRNLMRWGQNHS
ncbi:hypothetical protein EXIGLDRAFT_746955 [Exidia glandulosa HHB12029]|uniref:Uncharacterized protein n=1 Tax=Exidia glandulosa HHB12029 TaxID=1314781 RepID=A0A165LBW7_EXIGL|nr:hypothetical protein EXIGLDRAFT_746955 [Exidia glandulosa HHB12029]